MATPPLSLERLLYFLEAEQFNPSSGNLRFRPLGPSIFASEKERRKLDLIADEGELFFRPYDRHPTAACSFQARVDNKFKFRGARNLWFSTIKHRIQRRTGRVLSPNLTRPRVVASLNLLRGKRDRFDSKRAPPYQFLIVSRFYEAKELDGYSDRMKTPVCPTFSNLLDKIRNFMDSFSTLCFDTTLLFKQLENYPHVDLSTD